MLKAFAKWVGLQPAQKIQPSYSIQCGSLCATSTYDEYHCISSTSCSYAGCSCA